ncbi:MAG TPA: TROVE domain-containing protein [Chitinophagales bacterium]|nr:TROVE domain-containing protein [Chitinophagales bacterium]HNL84610.1 TROVE domain-containing protein [Chitinophagales bacterium]
MKFNIKSVFTTKVKNYEKADAYTMSPELELYAAVVTASLSDTFYEKEQERMERIRALIAKVDTLFVAKLAAYTRQKMNLRSASLVLAVELAKRANGNSIVKNTVNQVVQRADEITDLLAYYELANKRTGTKRLNKLSKQIQKGLAMSFNKFDEYQFAKYNRDAAIKLRDALFLVHPKAKDEAQQILFDKIAGNSLTVPYTWETNLSVLGQTKFETEQAKKAAFGNKWEEMIASGKIGYMAMLRNLRNILEAEVSYNSIEKICAYLSNAENVAKSKQLPFRFLSAYRELKAIPSGCTSNVMRAIEDAVKASAVNIKGYDADQRIVLACDVSSSMQKPVSARSKIMLYDIGLLLAMLLQSKSKNVITGMFGDRWKIINMPTGNILANVDEFYRREGEVGYSTNGYLVIEDLIAKNKIVDKVMMFTDCQLWDSRNSGSSMENSWNRYKRVAPNAKLYLFDLAGYGNTPLNLVRHDIFLIAGWSDKIFDVLAAIENGENALSEIKKMSIGVV